MKVVTIRFKNQKEWLFLLNLLKRLQLSFEWSEEKPIVQPTSKPEPKPERDVISELFGSWPSDKNSDELAKSIRDARVNQTREIIL